MFAEWIQLRFIADLRYLEMWLGGNKVPPSLWLASGGFQVAYSTTLMNSDSHACWSLALWIALLCGGPGPARAYQYASSAAAPFHVQNNNAGGFISSSVGGIKSCWTCLVWCIQRSCLMLRGGLLLPKRSLQSLVRDLSTLIINSICIKAPELQSLNHIYMWITELWDEILIFLQADFRTAVLRFSKLWRQKLQRFLPQRTFFGAGFTYFITLKPPFNAD